MCRDLHLTLQLLQRRFWETGWSAYGLSRVLIMATALKPDLNRWHVCRHHHVLHGVRHLHQQHGGTWQDHDGLLHLPQRDHHEARRSRHVVRHRRLRHVACSGVRCDSYQHFCNYVSNPLVRFTQMNFIWI